MKKIIFSFFLANFSLPEVAIGFDDVEYAELPFRDARNLIIYYRQQNQMIKEINKKRKKKKN